MRSEWSAQRTLRRTPGFSMLNRNGSNYGFLFAGIGLAQIQRDQRLTVVTLYRALGGGWQLPDDQWAQKP